MRLGLRIFGVISDRGCAYSVLVEMRTNPGGVSFATTGLPDIEGRCVGDSLAWPVPWAAPLFLTDCAEADKGTESMNPLGGLRGVIFLGALYEK
jgi:hypothetical protein